MVSSSPGPHSSTNSSSELKFKQLNIHFLHFLLLLRHTSMSICFMKLCNTVRKWSGVLASNLPNLETLDAQMRWRAYLRVSDRRSTCQIPFVLFKPSRGGTYMLMLGPAAVKIHLKTARTTQHVVGIIFNPSTGSIAKCTLDVVKLGSPSSLSLPMVLGIFCLLRFDGTQQL